MPIYFWNDPDGAKYKAAYFETYPGIWHHAIISGLATMAELLCLDAQKLPSIPVGVRIGTSEIYSIVENMNEIDDSVVVGQKYEDDERVILS